nr:MAG TPA: hypothetical protein [Caudoviricetes sp.]
MIPSKPSVFPRVLKDIYAILSLLTFINYMPEVLLLCL